MSQIIKVRQARPDHRTVLIQTVIKPGESFTPGPETLQYGAQPTIRSDGSFEYRHWIEQPMHAQTVANPPAVTDKQPDYPATRNRLEADGPTIDFLKICRPDVFAG
jgi:hypothetical protein